MTSTSRSDDRHLGLFGATGVGVGAIVGGGILVLGGVALAESGPGAMVAFALNGLIAALTVLSFAELASAFPESGGAYTFARKVLSVRFAFAVGWVLWFASIVAAVLYALGFAAYGAVVLQHLATAVLGDAPPWLDTRAVAVTMALAATGVYTAGLLRKAAGGGHWDTVGKVVVFVVLIAFGLLALLRSSPQEATRTLTPFFTAGAGGLITAMGFTFIALQGFDLIAAVGGEVKQPRKTIPRAMMISLGAALLIYLPLLFVVSTVGVPAGSSVSAEAASQPETMIASAAELYMGKAGYWLVVVAAVLSTLTALKANLLAASRVALTMARDRTLPPVLGRMSERRNTPVMAIFATALTLLILLLALPDVAAAGAAASLIFLIAFALAHYTAYLARRRAKVPPPFKVPFFPLVPVLGGVCCLALAVFQAVAVPAAGLIALAWLGLGVMLYLAVFSGRARKVDAYTQAQDPQLVRLRGQYPLALVPIANPRSAGPLVALASALHPSGAGRVLLLTVVPPPEEGWGGLPPERLVQAQHVLHEAMMQAFHARRRPEALMTVAAQPWDEIRRVAQTHRCDSIVLGLSNLETQLESRPLERLLGEVHSDVAILSAPEGWQLEDALRVLVPVGGRGGQDEFRARLLGSLCRDHGREISFLRVLPSEATDDQMRDARQQLRQFAQDEAPGDFHVTVAQGNDPAAVILDEALAHDLLVLGVQRFSRTRKVFGDLAMRIARDAPCATVLLSRRD